VEIDEAPGKERATGAAGGMIHDWEGPMVFISGAKRTRFWLFLSRITNKNSVYYDT